MLGNSRDEPYDGVTDRRNFAKASLLIFTRISRTEERLRETSLVSQSGNCGDWPCAFMPWLMQRANCPYD